MNAKVQTIGDIYPDQADPKPGERHASHAGYITGMSPPMTTDSEIRVLIMEVRSARNKELMQSDKMLAIQYGPCVYARAYLSLDDRAFTQYSGRYTRHHERFRPELRAAGHHAARRHRCQSRRLVCISLSLKVDK